MARDIKIAPHLVDKEDSRFLILHTNAFGSAEPSSDIIDEADGSGLAMLATLAGVDGGVTEETAPLYVDALRSFAASGAVSDGLVGPLGDAVEALGKADRSCFGVDDRVQVATWRLSLRTARTLRETDDTYDFCAAMKRVHKAVEALGVDESDAAVQRRDAIVHCLKSGKQIKGSPWAVFVSPGATYAPASFLRGRELGPALAGAARAFVAEALAEVNGCRRTAPRWKRLYS